MDFLYKGGVPVHSVQNLAFFVFCFFVLPTFLIINAHEASAKPIFLIINAQKPIAKPIFFIINAQKPIAKSLFHIKVHRSLSQSKDLK